MMKKVSPQSELNAFDDAEGDIEMPNRGSLLANNNDMNGGGQLKT